MSPVALATLAAVLIWTAATAQARPETPAEAKARTEIWGKEQAIYRARGKGDLQPYIDSVARNYLAWPPFSPVPYGVGALQQSQPKMAVENKELLEMEFVSFALNGDAAIIYYKTHRTRLPNGSPADERFEVTHSWVREGGQWKVYGGMARAQPGTPRGEVNGAHRQPSWLDDTIALNAGFAAIDLANPRRHVRKSRLAPRSAGAATSRMDRPTARGSPNTCWVSHATASGPSVAPIIVPQKA